MNTENKNENLKRLTANRLLIKDILNSDYIKKEGWNPNYLQTEKGNISKLQLIAFIIGVDNNSMTIDDSTGTIILRVFDEENIFSSYSLGDCVLVVGKPREFNGSKYVIPDIIKKVDKDWLRFHIASLDTGLVQDEKIEGKKDIEKKSDDSTNENKEIKENNDEEISSFQKIINLIENIDNGSGASIDELIIESKLDNAEKIINTLLEEGEIFEVRPGIVKVL
ncbi:hypothetical protein C0585_00140 [Candidatus Woesearchaeota archaeon]|nr:MAG: hypothetical protein C0585_00140 [Candidatus Woesearchaeota archaeon]